MQIFLINICKVHRFFVTLHQILKDIHNKDYSVVKTSRGACTSSDIHVAFVLPLSLPTKDSTSPQNHIFLYDFLSLWKDIALFRVNFALDFGKVCTRTSSERKFNNSKSHNYGKCFVSIKKWHETVETLETLSVFDLYISI